MTKIITDINIAVKEIKKGNAVGIPTETVYGLGANALDKNTVIKIFEAKDRPKFNPLIVHVRSIDCFTKYGKNIPENVYKLADAYSPGPITFIVQKTNVIPDIVTAGNTSIALRIPSHPVLMTLLSESGLPLAAPSANRSGRISPTSAKEVLEELSGKIEYILDGGKCSVGIESTVVTFLENDVKILRHGFITRKDIEKVIGKISNATPEKIISPGQSKNHYAPSTPLYLIESYDIVNSIKNKRIGYLDWQKYKTLKEIALNLFEDLRKLDKNKYDFIVSEKVEESGLGVAINDRLEKACRGRMKMISNELIVIKK